MDDFSDSISFDFTNMEFNNGSSDFRKNFKPPVSPDKKVRLQTPQKSDKVEDMNEINVTPHKPKSNVAFAVNFSNDTPHVRKVSENKIAYYENSPNRRKSKSSGHEISTQVCGKLHYHGLDPSDYQSNYIKVDKNDCTERVLVNHVFRKRWKLKNPKLLISVTGSALNFQMKPNLRSVFRRGIAQAAKSTSAWILTGGTNAGVMKHVGQSIFEYSAWREDDDDNNNFDVPLIGFATYETLHEGIRCRIDDREDGLTDMENCVLEDIPVESFAPNTRGAFLDRHHTHFVLVSSKDNRLNLEENRNPKFGEEIDLWARTEDFIINEWSSKNRDGTRKKIPALTIIVQGGPGSLQTAIDHLKKKIPLIAIRSSGGWSDVICDFCKDGLNLEHTSTPNFEYKAEQNEVVQSIKFENGVCFFESGNTNFQKTYTHKLHVNIAYRVVKQLIEYNMVTTRDGKKLPVKPLWIDQCIELYDLKYLVTVFELSQNQELDTAMMKAVLSAQTHNYDAGKTGHSTKISKILLAMEYDKVDLIKEELYHDDSKPLDQSSLGSIFNEAIRFRKWRFIDLLLEMDFDLGSHLTRNTLRIYYNYLKTQEHTVVLNAFDQAKTTILFEDPNNPLIRAQTPVTSLKTGRTRPNSNGNVISLKSLQSYTSNYFRSPPKETAKYSRNFETFNQLKETINFVELICFGPEYNPSFDDKGQKVSGETTIEDPLRHLLFWAVMAGDFELMEVFFKHLARYEGAGIIAALGVTTVLRQAASLIHSLEYIQVIKNLSNKYEKYAVEILNKAYNKAKFHSAAIVGLPRPTWGNMTPLRIAIKSLSREFVAQQGFQECLGIIWFYRVEPVKDVTGYAKLMLFSLIGWVPGVLHFLRFNELPELLLQHGKNIYLQKQGKEPDDYSNSKRGQSIKNSSDTDSVTSSQSSTVQKLKKKLFMKNIDEMNWRDKMVLFYRTPVITFLLNFFMYLCLIVIYAYFLMVKFCYRLEWLEILTITWMVSTFGDEFRQFFRSSRKGVVTKRSNYFNEGYNQVDIAIIILFSISMILRILACFYDQDYLDFKSGNWKDRGNIYGNCQQNGYSEVNNVVYSCDYHNYCPRYNYEEINFLFVSKLFHCFTYGKIFLKMLIQAPKIKISASFKIF